MSEIGNQINNPCFLVVEGSEDEIDVSRENLDDSMDGKMVPPQFDASMEQYNNNLPQRDETIVPNSTKLSLKPERELLEKTVEENFKYFHEKQILNMAEQVNSLKIYMKAREIVAGTAAVPAEIDLRDSGVFAKFNISRGTRYGPFQGKWAEVPQDSRFAFEVSFIL